jgi:predicted MFS family arabinose efflux permease
MVLVAVHGSLGQGSAKARFTQMFSNTRAVNLLSAARVFLFASRDVWFVVGLPVYLRSVLGWTFWEVGGFMAIWVIGYGIVQSASPRLLKRRSGHVPTGRTAALLALGLAILPAGIAVALRLDFDPATVLVVGLVIFGVVFALNSAVHSFLILHYADGDKVAMNVGFYYMANAFGRLAGTILSGLLYEWQGLEACLWASAIMVVAAGLISLALPGSPRHAIPVVAPTS